MWPPPPDLPTTNQQPANPLIPQESGQPSVPVSALIHGHQQAGGNVAWVTYSGSGLIPWEWLHTVGVVSYNGSGFIRGRVTSYRREWHSPLGVGLCLLMLWRCWWGVSVCVSRWRSRARDWSSTATATLWPMSESNKTSCTCYCSRTTQCGWNWA